MYKNLIFLGFVIFFVSCKNETEDLNKIKSDSFKINVDFPDTVYVNTYYNGKIIYKNALDTVTTKLLDIKRLRIIQFAYLKTKSVNYNVSVLKRKVTDTLYTKSSRSIELSDISFNDIGVNYIDGIITDEVYIDSMMLREGKIQPSTREIANDFRVTQRVVVIDKPKK